MRYSFRFEVYDKIYQVTLSTHKWYRIFCSGEELVRGELPFSLVDDAEDNSNYMNGYANCLLDIYLKQGENEFPMYTRGEIREDLWKNGKE